MNRQGLNGTTRPWEPGCSAAILGRLAMIAMIGLLIVASAAEAQQRGRGGRGGFGRGFFGGRGGGGPDLVALTRIEQVQKELEMLDDQIKEVAEIGGGPGAGRGGRAGRGGPDRPNFQDLSDEERQQLFAEMQKRREEQVKANEAKLAEILLPHQFDRLKQIHLQLQGVRALSDPEVAAQLKLTDAQQKEIERVNEENGQAMRTQMQALFQGGDREAMREKIDELRTAAEQTVLGVLDDSQKSQFDEMKGAKFELPPDAFRRGRGFRGGRRGGGGGGQRPERPARPERPTA